MMIHFLSFVSFVSLLLPVLIHGKRRNVLVLIGDDAGFETALYNNSVCQTPGLNYLASRGIVFDNAFTSVSSCSPSRSAILSGLPQHQNGMFGLHNTVHHFNSFTELRSLPLILQKAGVKTGIVGKKHVGPEAVYPFDFEVTEEQMSLTKIGRNVTLMKEKASEFLSSVKPNENFFLYIGFHDPHRCGSTQPQYGQFCEKFGNGEPGMGVIPDWRPVHYSPEEIIVPYHVQDTPKARSDIAAQYTTIGRMDRGVQLMLGLLEKYGFQDDTLVIFTSDNGIPFPSGRTNLYSAGMSEPFVLSSPEGKSKWGQRSKELVSLLDIVPTVLDWYGLEYPEYKLMGQKVQLTGQSLLYHAHGSSAVQEDSSLLKPNTLYYKQHVSVSDSSSRTAVFASHDLHECTMYYPMRSIRTQDFHLIHNLNFLMPFSIDQDFFASPTFQDLLERTRTGQPLHWYKTLKGYYYRPQWELYNIRSDPREEVNLARDEKYADVFSQLKIELNQWQNVTADPWICAPQGVLEFQGDYKANPRCVSLENGLKDEL